MVKKKRKESALMTAVNFMTRCWVFLTLILAAMSAIYVLVEAGNDITATIYTIYTIVALLNWKAFLNK